MPQSRITIIGTGLVGGSLGLALKKANIDVEIVGHDKEHSAAVRAQKRGAIDSAKWNLIDACDHAGLIILAIPLDGIKPTLDALKPHLQPGVILTDTTMTKAPVMNWVAELPTGVHYVSGDPIFKPTRAKSEHGIEAADPDIFQGATYCLVPPQNTPPQIIDTLSNLVSLIGAKPYFTDAAEHDGLVAGAKHLPVLVAAALGNAAMNNTSWRERSKFASGEFQRATELLAADPHTVSQELYAHRQDLARWLDEMQESLTRLRGLLVSENAKALEDWLTKLAIEREKWQRGDDADAGTSVDWADAQMNLGRMFVGGLADPKRRLDPKERTRGT